MAIDITIGGKLYTGASDYSVSEDSTPLDPSDNTGGAGQFTFGMPEGTDGRLLRDKVVTLSDGTQGTTTGVARGLSGDGSTVSITADSRLVALVATRTAQPFIGTLDNAFRYYIGLVGITTGIVVDPSAATVQVVLPGWSGQVWDYIKQLCAARGFECSLVSDNVVFRPVRGRVAENYRDSAVTWGLDATNLAQSVEVYYYNAAQKSNALAYPLGGWNKDVQIQQGLDAGATQTFNIPLVPSGEGLGASLTSIQQPVCMDSVDRYYGSSSVYSVTGGDGLPITASQWRGLGGSITVAIGDDTQSLKVTVIAPAETKYAPYSIAMSAGPSDQYSSLRLVGSGVFYNKKLVTFKTGADIDRAATLIGATVDSGAINTYEDAFHAGVRALGRYASAQQSLTVTTTGINRRDDSGSYRYPTMGEANADPDFAGKTNAQINTAFTGYTMAEFNAYEFAKVSSDFDNQAFGNVAGARVFNGDNVYRIRSVSQLTPSDISYTAEGDCTMGDINSALAGFTMLDISTLHAGDTMGDASTRPLLGAASPPMYAISSTVEDVQYRALIAGPPDTLTSSGQPGLFDILPGGQLTNDPANPGLYQIGSDS